MRDFRIWSVDEKRVEALWLSYLLTLCGCQVWKGKLGRKEKCHNDSNGHHYIDIVLSNGKEEGLERAFLEWCSEGAVWISGTVQGPKLYNDSFFCLKGIVSELDIKKPASIIALVEELYKIITEDKNERKAILQLAHFFIQKENELTGCIYTISEMFCSRRIDYSTYRNVAVLHQAISRIEDWLENYIYEVRDSMTYPEMFTIVYLRNLLNEGYIKAKKRGGYDTSLLLKNANYIWKYESESVPVLLLKLQILHNCINFSERPDDILKLIIEHSSVEYYGKALCEVGDIFREDRGKIPDRDVVDYYEMTDQEDVENYRGLYRAGLIYEGRAGTWYARAYDKYKQVETLLNRIDVTHKTPQEFEYSLKAEYGRLNAAIELDKVNGNLNYEKRDQYVQELKALSGACMGFTQLPFFSVMYRDGKVLKNILLLMDEKMSKIQKWASNLIDELV